MPPAMSDGSRESEPPQPKQEKKDNPDRSDVLAIGIGCAVFVIMFIAIVLVGMSGR
jgi:hypothetical protein